VKQLLARANAHKAVTAVVVSAVVVGGVAVAGAARPTMATVTKIVDGDTIDVRYGGEEHRVRLLNIDTPESVDPSSPVECLGPEASAWLEERLPLGTEVRLERDQETRDQYDRELAAVFVGDEFLSAEIARAGLGIAVSFGANVRYLPPVQAAQSEAEDAGRGLYATSVECTLPAQVEELTTDAMVQDPAATADLAAFDTHAAELAAVLATGTALLALLDGDAQGLPLSAYADQVADLRHRVSTVQERLRSAAARNTTARAVRQEQLAEQARRAAEEAARLAAEEAAQRAAAEAARQAAVEAARQAEAERAAAAARAAQRAASTYRPPAPSTPSRTQAPPPPSSGGGGSSSYTGCRSYAPGGKTWTPIPC